MKKNIFKKNYYDETGSFDKTDAFTLLFKQKY